MDVYDFDGTLYCGDSTVDFVRHCLKRYPRIMRTLPRTGVAALACLGMHIIEKTQFKAALYRFLPLIPDVGFEVACFWKTHESKIGGPCEPKPGDLVISASPEFLLKPLEKKLNITVIASKVDINTGKYDGLNCYHAEKVKLFRELYTDGKIDTFYSDSYSDEPLALLADKAYIVDGDTLIDWDYTHHKKNLRT